MTTKPLPLSGIKVVEFSHMVMGPSCGLILGDLGADVVKVEPVEKGDNTRRLPGSGAGFFPTFNRNKRSLAVDIKTPKGLALVKRLIGKADVVTENFRPGALNKLGLGYENFKPSHPRLVYCSLKGFLSGPYDHRAALDEVVQMMGGLAYMTGPVGRPLRAGAPVNDMMGGMFAAIAIMAALIERNLTGEGQFVQSALFENNSWLVSPHMAQQAVTGKEPSPMPSRLSAWAVYDVFDTADHQQIFVGIVTDTQWRAFCAAFDQPELAADESLLTNPQRVAARDRFMPKLREIFGAMTRTEAADLCETTGLPFAPIRRPGELFDDPQLNMPGGMIEVRGASGQPVRIPALPIEMAGRRFAKRLEVPSIGGDSAGVAKEIGCSDAEIEAMFNEAVISGPN